MTLKGGPELSVLITKISIYYSLVDFMMNCHSLCNEVRWEVKNDSNKYFTVTKGGTQALKVKPPCFAPD